MEKLYSKIVLLRLAAVALIFTATPADALEWIWTPANKIVDTDVHGIYVQTMTNKPGPGGGLAIRLGPIGQWKAFNPGEAGVSNEVSVIGVGSLLLAGVASADDGARATAVPLLAPFSFFDNRVTPGIGWNFVDQGLAFGLAVKY